MKKWMKDLIIFIVFGAIYFGLECLWRGSGAHWTLFFLGGFIGFLIQDINGKMHWKTPFLQQCTIGMGVAIFSEAVAGIILNVILKLDVWHYQRMTFFWNQCNLPFCIIWLFLSAACIVFDDWLRWKFFGEEKPTYRWR